MGVAATYSVTRRGAKDTIKELLRGKKLTNRQIELILEIAINNEFYNFDIVEIQSPETDPNICSVEYLLNIATDTAGY